MPQDITAGRASVEADPADQEPSDIGESTPESRTPRARLRAWLPISAILIAAVALVIGTIGPPLVGKGVFLGTDALTQVYPWRAFDDPRVENVADHGPIGDTVDSGVPARTAFYDALDDGEFLAWNPYVVGGKPLGSHSSNGVLNPIALTAYGLFPSWYAPALVKLLTMVAGIGFTFLFCRRLGVDRPAALFGGMAFAGSGFMVMWTNWSQVEVAALIPALFWATERFLQRPRPATAVPIALAVAAMILGNFPAVVFYTLYILVPYVAVRVALMHGEALRRRLSLVGAAGAAVVAGATLVAATLIPFALGLDDTGTGDRAEHPGNHPPVPTLLTSVAPGAFGLSTGGPDEAYFGPYNQIEVIAFVGVTTAMLALLGAALPRLRNTPAGARGVLVAATVVIGWATFVGGDLLQLLQNLPAFDNSFVGRTRSVLGFTVAVLAALGLQSVADRRWPVSRSDLIRVATTLVATALVAAVVFDRALTMARAAERAEVLRGALIVPAVIGALAVAAATIAARGDRKMAAAALAVLPVLLVVESLEFSLPLLPNEDRATYYPSTPGIDELAAAAGDDGRIAPERATLLGSASTVYDLRSATGHAFAAREWKDALRTVDPTAYRHSRTFAMLAGTPEVMTSPILDRMGVQWFAGSAHTPPPGVRRTTAASDASCDAAVKLDGEPVRVTVPLPAGARAVVVRTCSPPTLPADTHLEARIEGTHVRARVLLPGDTGPSEVTVALPAEDVEAPEGADIELSVASDREHAVEIATDAEGRPIVDVIEPEDDGLRLVYADDLRIYERTHAVDRIRWAGRAETVTHADQRLARLASGDVDDSTVVLSEDGPPGSGEQAQVQVTRDAPGRIDVTVTADGDGYLVVADSVQSSWLATVDGNPVDLVAADHATAAIHVPAGEHDVMLRYRPEGQRAGLALSAVTAVALAALVAWDVRRSRPRPQPIDIDQRPLNDTTPP